MEPRKITGLTVDPGDGSPLIDVDTAILALHEQLGREGAKRAQNALGALINFATMLSAGSWQVLEHRGEGLESREVESVEYTTRTIILVPSEEWGRGRAHEQKGGDDGAPST